MVRRAAAAYLVIHLFAIAWAHSSPWLNESTSAVESSFAFQDVDPQEEIINWTIESSGSSPVSALDPGSADKFRVKRASVASTTTPATTTTMIASSTTTKKPTILLVKDFETFKKTYKKSYKRRFREYRSKIAFDQNRDLVVEQEKQFKQGRSSFRCSTNVMSDLSQIEYLMRYVRMTSNHYNSLLDGEHLVSAPMVDSKDIPEELDWRKSGFVTPPDNQKSCGSCYAFSIARSIEGQVHRRTGRLVQLSAQQMVDCSTTHGNHGCSGGSLRNTLRYLEKSGGLMRAEDYPYANTQQRCRFIHQMAVVNVSSWNILPPKSEDSLKIACATVGPLAVSINAAPRTFQLYGDGIYDDTSCSSETLNHAMLLVGYTKEYWILKNWWGQNWGEGGYMRLQRGSNLCGVSNFAAYAIV